MEHEQLAGDVMFTMFMVIPKEDLYPLVNLQKTMENHHVSWINPLFLWPFSLAKKTGHF